MAFKRPSEGLEGDHRDHRSLARDPKLGGRPYEALKGLIKAPKGLILPSLKVDLVRRGLWEDLDPILAVLSVMVTTN